LPILSLRRRMHISGQLACDNEIARMYFIDLDYPADFCFIPPATMHIRAGSGAGDAH
jgi:hypothetical protein